jgi:hypothetical protein
MKSGDSSEDAAPTTRPTTQPPRNYTGKRVTKGDIADARGNCVYNDNQEED